MANITIDGKKFEVPNGITVLEAAKSADIHIPTLCDHPNLTPFGGCRMCVVEVEGARTLQTSCTLPVMDNMVVRTDTDKVKNARKFILTMIFSDRNHFCPYCVVNDGDCELQQAAYSEGMTHWPLQPNWQSFEVDASHEYFIHDHNRCILCRRCVRACHEIVGNNTLGVEERGAKSMIIADLGIPQGESSCISCGTCVQVCPTGSLIDRWSAYRGQEKSLESVKTICTGCSIGCGIEVFFKDNHIVRIDGDWDAEVNGGVICKLGRFIPLDEQRERILTPMVKQDGKLKVSTWENALAEIESKFKPLLGKKDDGVAAIASPRLTAEALYGFKTLFADGFKSEMVTTTDEGAFTTPQSALAEEMKAAFEGDLDAIDNADSILVLNADLVNDHQVASFFVKRNVSNTAKLVVVDSKDNELSAIAQQTIKTKNGDYLNVIKGITKAVEKLGLSKEKVQGNPDKDLETASNLSGISSEEYLKAAVILASVENPVIVYDVKNMTEDSVITLKALLELAKACGAVSISTKGLANSSAAAQYKLTKTFKVNGHQAVFAALADEEPTQKLVKTLENAGYLVVQASYHSKLTAMADVVLPVEIWAEQEGHFVNLEGKVQKANKVLCASEEIRSNADVLNTITGQVIPEVKDQLDNWQESLSDRVSATVISE